MKPSTKRLVSFTIAMLLVVAALVVFFDLLQPAYGDLQVIKAQVLQKEASLSSEKAAAAQVKSLLDQYHGDQNPQSEVSSALPPKNDQAEAVHEIQEIAALHQLTPQSVSVSQAGAKPLTGVRSVGAAGVSSTAALVKPVGVVNMQIRLAGTYDNFKQFLEATETNVRLTDVQSLTISPVGKANQDFYTFDLTLSTYYQNP